MRLLLSWAVLMVAACSDPRAEGSAVPAPAAYVAEGAEARLRPLTAGEVIGPVLKVAIDAAQYGLPAEAQDLRTAAEMVLDSLDWAGLSPASRVQLTALRVGYREATQDTSRTQHARDALVLALRDAGADLVDTSRVLAYLSQFGAPWQGESRTPRLPDEDPAVLNVPLTYGDVARLRRAVLRADASASGHGPQYRHGLGVMMAALVRHGSTDSRWRALVDYAAMERRADGGMEMGRAMLPPVALRWLRSAASATGAKVTAVTIRSPSSLLPPP